MFKKHCDYIGMNRRKCSIILVMQYWKCTSVMVTFLVICIFDLVKIRQSNMKKHWSIWDIKIQISPTVLIFLRRPKINFYLLVLPLTFDDITNCWENAGEPLYYRKKEVYDGDKRVVRFYSLTRRHAHHRRNI